MNRPEQIEKDWPQDGQHTEMCVCPACQRRDFMQPVEWEQLWDDAAKRETSWRVRLHCAECNTFFRGIFSSDQIDNFDEVLDEGSYKLVEEFEAFDLANMAAEVERFIGALGTNAIVPEDFTIESSRDL